jgi:hypothetical protein
METRHLLIAGGVILILAGIFLPFLLRLGLGRLPGDIVVERENFRFYFPVVTCLVISVGATLLFWLFRR